MNEMIGHDPATGAWNVSATGDYLWSNTLCVEVFPLTAKPATWSIWQIIFNQLSLDEAHPIFGYIAGRPYFNYSVMYSLLLTFVRNEERAREMLKDMVGLPPRGIVVPPYPLSLKTLLFRVIPREFKGELRKRRLKKDRERFLAAARDRCRALRQQIRETTALAELVTLWPEEIKPLLLNLFTLQDGFNEEFSMQNRTIGKDLPKLVGEGDARVLLSTVGSGSDQLTSVGPLLGLARVQQGQMSREEYLDQYGHRGPYENYVSIPRPYEDTAWLDYQLEALSQAPVDVTRQLAAREAEFHTTWEWVKPRLGSRKQEAIWRRFGEMNATCAAREQTRAELTRMMSIIRDLFLRAGDLSGLGEDVFFLTIDELLDLLSGDDRAKAHIPARRETYARDSALPTLPTWIRGRFDPYQWAADPNRRKDVFDAYAPLPRLDTDVVIQGKPGSAGRAEGIARLINSPEEGNQLESGEILVASTTNIGWTMLFPRAAAIVTDIGGALSHAAIVARELGIPAVVGCGDATMRLKTGDRVRVDGGQGTVEIL